MATQPTFFEHTTKQGDRWDLLAYSYYGDVRKQSVLLEANRHLFLDPLVVPPMILDSGLVLKIPVIEVAEELAHGLPPWKTGRPTYGNGTS